MTNFSGLSVNGAPVVGNSPSPYGNVLFVDGNRGADGNNGKSTGRAFATMAKAMTVVGSGDVIYVRGNITENITAPAGVFDVRIIGAGPLRPRHADAHTGTNGYSAATWRAAVQTDPLLILRQQGWEVRGIAFDAPTSDACIELIRDAASGDSERDASHAAIIGNKFVSGATGILISGTENLRNVLIENNVFADLTDAIDSPGGYAYQFDINNNMFLNNTNHIDCGLTQSTIRNNNFGNFTTMSIDLTGGANNSVYGNNLSGTYSIVGGYKAGTNDEWGGNFNSLSGGITAADPA